MAHEREMTRNQRGLVYTCFEEGQYESGIITLDLLRSPAFRPPPDIIRQLLYIALYPPPRSSPSDFDEYDTSFFPVKGLPSTQKKFLSNTSLTPTLAASEAAQRLLMSFLSTNSSGALFRCLSCHTGTPTNEDYDEDSVIARESLCIKNSRCCWELVKEGFIQRKNLVPILQKRTQKRQRVVANGEVEDGSSDETSLPLAIVADHAWLVLDWLVSLFEKDEKNAKTPDARYSTLLLSQVASPRDTPNYRREVDTPLDIVFYCLEQDNSVRREMGIRLFTLLINLTITTDFDAHIIAAAVIIRLHSSASEVIQRLFTSLPKTTVVLTFQVITGYKYLSDVSPLNQRNKPQVRPRCGSTTNSGPIPPSRGNNLPVSRVQPSAPSFIEILRLVESQRARSFLSSTMKYVLITSYAFLQSLVCSDQQDPIWKEALLDGRLIRTINASFPDIGEGSEYQHALLVICKIWSQAKFSSGCSQGLPKA